MGNIIFGALRAVLPALILLAACRAEGVCAPVFTEVQGKVLYRASADQEWAQASPGLRVAAGGRVKTGWFSWAEIRYDERTMIGLGFDTDLTIYTAKADEYFSKLAAGTVRAVVKTAIKFTIKTPVSVVAVKTKGTRFVTVATALGQTKVKVFSGIVTVSDAKTRDKAVKPEETLSIDEEGSGPPERAASVSLGGGWAIDPPYGFRARGKTGWEMKTFSPTSVSFKGIEVSMERTETLSLEKRQVRWEKGQDWPMQCPAGLSAREVRIGSLEGKPFVSYACPSQDLGRAEWQNRYYEMPIEDSAGAVSSALRMRYKHSVQAKLPSAAELGKLYGRQPAGGYAGRFQADVMPLIAAAANKTKLDGPGIKAATESVLTLYREIWAGSNTDEYSGKVVPMIQ